MKKKIINRMIRWTIACFVIGVITSCGYKDRVQPLSLPVAGDKTVVLNGLYIAAVTYEDKTAANEAFGFDIRKAGLLPVQVSFQNEGEHTVQILPTQTYLLDNQNQAWPINSQERTYQRIEKHVDLGEAVAGTGKSALLFSAAGAVAGLAVGIVTGENIGESVGKGAAVGAAAGVLAGGAQGYLKAKDKIRTDLRSKALENKKILPNQLAYGVIFFPGFSEEAKNAKTLKLTLSFDGNVQTVNISLTPPPVKKAETAN